MEKDRIIELEYRLKNVLRTKQLGPNLIINAKGPGTRNKFLHCMHVTGWFSLSAAEGKDYPEIMKIHKNEIAETINVLNEHDEIPRIPP